MFIILLVLILCVNQLLTLLNKGLASMRYIFQDLAICCVPPGPQVVLLLEALQPPD